MQHASPCTAEREVGTKAAPKPSKTWADEVDEADGAPTVHAVGLRSSTAYPSAACLLIPQLQTPGVVIPCSQP